MTTHRHFSVLSPIDFLRDVSFEAGRAKKRVWAQAMEVEPGEKIDILLHALTEAAARGIDTRLQADNYSLLVTDGTFNYWPFVNASFRKHRNARIKKKLQMKHDLL